ncbi:MULTISPECIES: hypothetical protein [unclassified Tenacibaculum]|uniref:hypothetical protein n=1 Tax=unclassified Tenacibaculum TaxID=2635139 RepID=UPI001F43F2E1|nr:MULTISPECIES: hypothetical protein [unclassified Tenacibaculum]MCF2873168.1 hypothetical protein [Tenacibaculum sp. Cn5-1]MCF2933324.1 hypothetical protein [Tenacibaculum sp. Cn5-34]MCG7510095.1 hypothetical protein [Tenacibaculum sp. Cn5-46]
MRFNQIIKLWKQFIPLSLTDMAMALGEPVRNYAIASLPNGELNLASFGIAKSLANFFEAPIIMVLHASNALAQNKESSKKFLRFTLVFSLLLAGLFLCFSIPNVFEFLGKKIFSLSIEVSETTRRIIYFIFLFPFVIGWRRYFQGILIQQKKNNVVAQASLVRLFFVIGIPILGLQLDWSGLTCAISSLLGGLFVEAVYVSYFSLKLFDFNNIESQKIESLPKTYKELFNYYFPLGYSMVIIWGTRTLLVFLLSFAIDSKISLILWPIIWGIVLIVSNGTRMVQQVYISNKEDFSFEAIRNFCITVGIAFTILFLFLIITPLGNSIIYISMGKLISYNALILNCLSYFLFFPALTTFQNILQGELIISQKTRAIGIAAIPSHILLVIVAYGLIKMNFSGLISLAIALNLGLIFEILFLFFFIRYELMFKNLN